MLQIYNFWARNQERTKHNFGATVDIYVYVKIGRAQLPDTSLFPFQSRKLHPRKSWPFNIVRVHTQGRTVWDMDELASIHPSIF